MLLLVPARTVSAPAKKKGSFESGDLYLSAEDEALGLDLRGHYSTYGISAYTSPSKGGEKGFSGPEGEIVGYIKEVFGDRADEAVRIARCESNLNPEAVNLKDAEITGWVSTGLFQHNEGYFPGWDDYRVSTDKAWEKFQERGWQPWYNCARIEGLI